MLRNDKEVLFTSKKVLKLFLIPFLLFFLSCEQNNNGDTSIDSSKIDEHLKSLEWKEYKRDLVLNRQILLESLELGRKFLINNQKEEGNFNYQYDFVKKEFDNNDSQVRQAGALWGVSLLFHFKQDRETKAALDKGLAFFFKHTIKGETEKELIVAYPGESKCKTGTVALLSLSIIDYLRTEKEGNVELDEEYKDELESKLRGYLNHLIFMQLDYKSFSKSYHIRTKIKYPSSSPYFDGETLLCLIKAAKYLGYTDLLPVIESAAKEMSYRYTFKEWEKVEDSDNTKGFFQWGSMSFWEYQDAGWKNSEVYGDYLLSLSWWMIHVHHTLKRTRNTAYAYEGIIPAYELAKKRGDDDAKNELLNTIDIGLHKLTSWQVGGPLKSKNKFLVSHPTEDPIAVGGVMNHRRESPLRIDVTQHQVHALIMALKYVYTE